MQINNDIEIQNPVGVKEVNNLFPVFLKLEQMTTLIVGGGNVALEKLNALLYNSPSAKVILVATSINKAIKEISLSHKHIELIERSFEPADLKEADIIILAVNNIGVSKLIKDEANAIGKLVNVADKPELCDFYLSSVVRKGNLKIAISTNGKSPTIAKRLKETFNETLPPELDDVLDNMQAIRQKLEGNFAYKVKRLNAITKNLAGTEKTGRNVNWKKIATYSVSAFGLMLVGHFILSYVPIRGLANSTIEWYGTLDKNFHWMVMAGFLAQLVDGALGMGYGVTSATILLSAGVNLSAISGSIHTAEIFASGASGYSHYKFGNVNKKLFKLLIIPGVIGAILGAILLAKFGDTHAQYLRPVMAAYTLFLGLRILLNAFREQKITKKFKNYGPLAGIGGFLDSFGGGGWGPIVTTTLITKGRSPKYVIGSVSLTEFFVTLASAFTFFTILGVSHWQVIVALIIGGLIAAPLAAKLSGRLPRKSSFILLGILVIVWSLRILIKIF